MAEADKPVGFWDTTRLWLNAVGVPVVIALLGVWQFWLKEVVWPANAPVNITTDVSIRDAGHGRESADADQALEAIELVITARNPGTRVVYLLPNFVNVYGIKVKRVSQAEDKWKDTSVDIINRAEHWMANGRDYQINSMTWIGSRNVFSNTSLFPQEKTSNSFVFYVPRGEYDSMIAIIHLPTSAKEHPTQKDTAAMTIKYSVRADRLGYDEMPLPLDDRGSPMPFRPDKDGHIPDKEFRNYGFQSEDTTIELSLWPTSKNESGRPSWRSDESK